MIHVAGINLLTCVNWEAWQNFSDCGKARGVDIYVLYVCRHKMTGHLIWPLQPSGWLYFIYLFSFFCGGQGALLAFKQPLTCERF